MTEQTMVERGAEALWQAESIRATDGPRRSPWSEESDSTRDKWRFMFRAAIEAMREPTAEMIEAMEDSYQPDEVWRAMIDAALAPRKQCDKPT